MAMRVVSTWSDYVRDMLLMPIIGGSTAIQKNNIANRMGLPKA